VDPWYTPGKEEIMKWRAYAQRRWPEACWVSGEGRYASLAHCRELTIQLYDDEIVALLAKRVIDDSGCGGACHRDHEVIDLKTNKRINRKLTEAECDEAMKLINQ
jgi:hypothetical protein